MYWAYQKLSVCVLWTSMIMGVFFFFPNLIGKFMVDLVIGCPFVYMCEFGLS